MTQKKLLDHIKKNVHDIEPNAEIILYGSRARHEAGSESDWDLLILVDGDVDHERVRRVRHHLYELELETDEIISSIVENRQTWNSSLYQAMPFHENVEREGIVI